MPEQKSFNVHRELLHRCMKGDRLAQKELYRLYYKAMYNTCYRMLNNKAEAEDIMQESFLAAFLKMKTYRGEMSFGSWLKRIVINKSIDALRAKKIEFEELNEKTDLKAVTNDDDLYNFENDKPEIEKIRSAVSMLPEGFRVVLSLALFEGYDHEEIALILKISESTSRSQLARGKKKLVEYLNKSDYESFG
jgi:RNA polymerase sigma factor (sigma-70 family)